MQHLCRKENKTFTEQNMKQYSTLGAEKWIKMQPFLKFRKLKKKKEQKYEKIFIRKQGQNENKHFQIGMATQYCYIVNH